ncbi:hypothetical protein, partial [Salmonella enterica]|uniref:hypothetical protein n=1 Tax=Salmonella enterica TaxID=28901 RepID=UPI003298DDC9
TIFAYFWFSCIFLYQADGDSLRISILAIVLHSPACMIEIGLSILVMVKSLILNIRYKVYA